MSNHSMPRMLFLLFLGLPVVHSVVVIVVFVVVGFQPFPPHPCVACPFRYTSTQACTYTALPQMPRERFSSMETSAELKRGEVTREICSRLYTRSELYVRRRQAGEREEGEAGFDVRQTQR